MLSLQLRSGEYITIGDNIAVQVFQQAGSSFRVSIKAPREIPIVRGEVLERVGEQRPEGLQSNRPKSPSDQRRNARRLQFLAEKQARKEQILQDMREILGRMENLSEADATRMEVRALLSRLNEIETAP